MLPTNRSNRRSPANRSSDLRKPIAELLDEFGKRLQANRRRQQLRRQRQQQKRSEIAAEQQNQGLGRAWKVRLPQRRRPRQPPEEHGPWALRSLIRPRLGNQSFSSRDAAARLLRLGAAAILLLILISLVLNAVPLRLVSPSWYLQVFSYIAENVPALIIASIFALLSLALGEKDEAARAYLSKLTRLVGLGYILALLLLPLQVGFTAWLYGEAFNTNRTQLSIIRSNANALISGAQQTNTNEEFIAYLQSRRLSANLESIAAAPLIQVKTEFILGVQTNQQQQEQALGATTRSTMLRYATNSIKLFATLVVLTGFMRGLQTLVSRCLLDATNLQSGRLDEITARAEHEQIA